MAVETLRVFISSPGDVGQERLLATRVLERLQGEFSRVLNLEPILWEHEPLQATAHFQEQITPPSQADIVICILWARLGTRLPDQFRRADGTTFSSGTEWEFEDAIQSFRERGRPALMVYRKTVDPVLHTSDEEVLLRRLQRIAWRRTSTGSSGRCCPSTSPRTPRLPSRRDGSGVPPFAAWKSSTRSTRGSSSGARVRSPRSRSVWSARPRTAVPSL